jgi:glutathione synthase/RimK-type ligase-like ATP-grasp enzyme
MQIIIVVNNPSDWPFDLPNVQVVAARSYLTDPRFMDLRNTKVFNLCRSYRYQSTGYYVSLLAAARGHKPIPGIATIQDLKMQTIVRIVSDELEDMIQQNLASIRSDKFVLSIYFGRNLAKKYDRLSSHLFNLFQAPLLRAHFAYNGNKWYLQSLGPIAAAEIPSEHRDFIAEAAKDYFAGKRKSIPRKFVPRYDLAILRNPAEKAPPSDDKALSRFMKAAEQLGIGSELIAKEDYARLAEFDGLFIRETTNVNHHTFRFARRAAAEGLVVIDDPESILRCTNKVYLAELLNRHDIPAPRTMILHRDNIDRIGNELGFPLILKQPDGSFSQGVVKVTDAEMLALEAGRFLDKSDLVIAQEFMPTEYDWRIGIIDRKPVYACRYYMAKKHWQIIKTDKGGGYSYGNSETVPVELAPGYVVKTALKAANLIGDGLYGVDVKQADNKCYVIEVNDNPNLDSGVEDLILKDELYLRIMRVFLDRMEARKEGRYRY